MSGFTLRTSYSPALSEHPFLLPAAQKGTKSLEFASKGALFGSGTAEWDIAITQDSRTALVLKLTEDGITAYAVFTGHGDVDADDWVTMNRLISELTQRRLRHRYTEWTEHASAAPSSAGV